MPNIEFYFPSPGLSALLELLLWCREQQPAVTCCPATPAFCTRHPSGARVPLAPSGLTSSAAAYE